MVTKHCNTAAVPVVLVVGLVIAAMSSLPAAADPKDGRAPRRPTDTGKVDKRVIMVPVSVVGTPAPGEEDSTPEIRIYCADKLAVPVIPTAIDLVYASREDEEKAAAREGEIDILNVKIPVTLLNAPKPGETGYISEIQVDFAGDKDMPRIPTEVRVVYSLGERDPFAGMEYDLPSTKAKKTCSWKKIDGKDVCSGTCAIGQCAAVTITHDSGSQVTRCQCITIHEQ